MGVECPRCGEPAGESRWCETCGKDLSGAGAPALPTPESMEAARREAAWLQDHPDVAESEWAEYQVRERAQAEFEEGRRAAAAVGPEEARDPSGVARIARWSLIAMAAVTAFALAMEARHLSVISDLSESDFPNSVRLDDSEVQLGIAYIALLVVFLVTVVTFIVWLYRVYSNLKPLGAYELRFGKGWAIGGWFVPILNWWRPKQIVNDAWRASDPDLGFWTHRREWEDAPVPPLFLLWWLLLLAGSILDRISSRMYASASTLDAERSATIVSMCASALSIAAAILAVMVVRRVTDRQVERAAARERMAGLDQAAATAPATESAQGSSA